MRTNVELIAHTYATLEDLDSNFRSAHVVNGMATQTKETLIYKDKVKSGVQN